MSLPTTIEGCTVLAAAQTHGTTLVLLLHPGNGSLKTARVEGGIARAVHHHTKRSAAHADFRARCWTGE